MAAQRRKKRGTMRAQAPVLSRSLITTHGLPSPKLIALSITPWVRVSSTRSGPLSNRSPWGGESCLGELIARKSVVEEAESFSVLSPHHPFHNDDRVTTESRGNTAQLTATHL